MNNSRIYVFLLFFIFVSNISCSDHDDIDAMINDTDSTWIPKVIHDTIYKDSIIHDTIIKDSIIHDTLYVDSLIHDTIVVDNVVHDTIIVDSIIYDTVIIEHGIKMIRLAGWNIGHFALGKHYDTRITHDNYDSMQQKWREAINSINADVLCLCEYNDNFINKSGDSPAVTARNSIFNCYHFAYIGKRPYPASYNMSAIYSHLPLQNIKQIQYNHAVQAGRHFYYGELKLNEKTVKIVSTHLDFNQNSNGAKYRKEQMQELIDYFSNDPYVIIYADWNVSSVSEFDMFAEARWSMANHGYWGDIPTYPAGNKPIHAIDNIICKGFEISNVNTLNDGTLSDHVCIIADLTLIE